MKLTYCLTVMALTCFMGGQGRTSDVYAQATQTHTNVLNPQYFGVHFHRLVLLPSERAVPTQWPELPFGSLRLWDSTTRWGDIAPNPGVWNFERMDTFVNSAVKHHASVLYTLGSTPRWASARPDEKCSYGFGCGAESVRLAHWEEYVRRVAQQYGDQINAYELWNEPNFSDFARDAGTTGFFTGSVQTMVAMAKSARKILDQHAPNARLCTPGFVNGPDRLEKFLADGGSQHVQAICYHFYAEGSDHFIKQVNEVKAVMDRQGVRHLPLWNTETGVDTLLPTDPHSGIAARSREEAVSRLVQMLILGAASGIERFYYYAWDNRHSGMVSNDGNKLFGHDALQKTQAWLSDSQFSGCTSKGPLVTCQATKGSERSLYVWATRPVQSTISLPAGTRVIAVDSVFGPPPTLTTNMSVGKAKMEFNEVPVRFQIESISTKSLEKTAP